MGLNMEKEEKKDDLISRRAAVEALYDWELSYTWDEHCKEEQDSPYIVSPSKIVNELPPAQPKTSRIENALHGKSPEEQYDFLKWLMLDYAMWSTDSRAAVIEWLEGREEPTMEEYMYGQEGSEEDGSL